MRNGNSQWHRLAATAALLAPLLLGLAERAHAEINVVVTIKPVHSLAAAVLGDIAKPTVLIKGNASPHTFAMKPSDADMLSKADVFVRISEVVEPFTKKLKGVVPKTTKVLTLADAKGITLLPKRRGGTFETHSHGKKGHRHDHDHDHGKSQAAAFDGHIWLDPPNAKAIVLALAAEFSALRPQHAATFQANATAALKRLDALDAELTTTMAPAKAQPLIVFHDAYQYFERHYGLNTVGSITVDPDVQPSGKRLTELRKKVATLGAVCVLSEPQFPNRIVSAIIEPGKSRTGQMDPLGATLEPGPELYFQVLRGMAAAVRTCTGAGS